MKLSIKRETLLEPLQMVIGVVERRQTLPILANVLLTVQGTQLSVTATDMEIELVANILLENETKPTQLTVSGRKLLDIVRTLPENAIIDMQQDKERVIVRSGGSRFTLTTLPVTSFPKFEVAADAPALTLVLTQQDLATVLQRSHFAMAQQDVRYYLNGMLLDVKNNRACAVATDGHRFALNSTAMNTEDKSGQVILPRKGVLELMRLLKQDDSEISVTIGENYLRVHNTAFTFTSRLIDGRFPDYERVLPTEQGNSITLNRDAFKNALLRASILSNEKLRTVRLQARSGFLHIGANNPEHEESEEILSIDYAGEELDIAFNVSYLLDVLNTTTSEDIQLRFIDTNTRLFMQEPNNQNSMFLIMPLQI